MSHGRSTSVEYRLYSPREAAASTLGSQDSTPTDTHAPQPSSSVKARGRSLRIGLLTAAFLSAVKATCLLLCEGLAQLIVPAAGDMDDIAYSDS